MHAMAVEETKEDDDEGMAYMISMVATASEAAGRGQQHRAKQNTQNTDELPAMPDDQEIRKKGKGGWKRTPTPTPSEPMKPRGDRGKWEVLI
eukprot:278850-Pyramimonas_sp.AAC.1